GVTFQCDGKQVAIAPNVCAKDSLIGEADESGKVAKFETVDAGKTYNPPPA
ncbi:MAG: hypothetical protein JWP31_2296, partial [Aeromicrobium sp.]|nr:hypothetical protein [Aeromicrobium sp.]